MVEALNRIPQLHVELATTDADGRDRLDLRRLSIINTPLHVFPKTCSERWKISISLWNWLSRHAADFDLVHIHAIWSFTTTAASRAARRAGIPIIVRPCGMLSSYSWSRGALTKRLYWKLVERTNLRGAACFHVTSQDEAKEVASCGLNSPVVVIPQGTDPGAWLAPTKPGVLRTLCGQRAHNLPIVLFLSRLHPKKGVVDILLPALARTVLPCCVAIAGGEDSHETGYEEQIRSRIEELGLSERVVLLGAIAPEDRWGLFDGATIFVLPSHSENFGIVVTEAMARGVPVIVTDRVQACEHVRAACSGRVIPLDSEILGRTLGEMLADPIRCGLLGENGRHYVQEHLHWDAIAITIAEMYQRTIDGQIQGPGR